MSDRPGCSGTEGSAPGLRERHRPGARCASLRVLFDDDRGRRGQRGLHILRATQRSRPAARSRRFPQDCRFPGPARPLKGARHETALLPPRGSPRQRLLGNEHGQGGICSERFREGMRRCRRRRGQCGGALRAGLPEELRCVRRHRSRRELRERHQYPGRARLAHSVHPLDGDGLLPRSHRRPSRRQLQGPARAPRELDACHDARACLRLRVVRGRRVALTSTISPVSQVRHSRRRARSRRAGRRRHPCQPGSRPRRPRPLQRRRKRRARWSRNVADDLTSSRRILSSCRRSCSSARTPERRRST